MVSNSRYAAGIILLISTHIRQDTLKTLGQYALTAILCLLILIWVMKLWRADFKVPFAYFGDSLLYRCGFCQSDGSVAAGT